ncbi:hypothetical protein ABZ845_11980 [Streptomyces sp. NPDC047022]|uniref:hypothetical protein n=1 Tax=Streptomyces sp. NPDC047022 TaxID=3155737 RepID=UPI0033E4FB35
MKLRNRLRASLVALGLAASSLTIATLGATQAHACGKSALGPVQTITAGSQSIGNFYLAWNNCPSPAVVYTEIHLWNTRYTNASGQILVANTYPGGTYATGPSKPTIVSDGTAWWDAGPISIYSRPSSTRTYYGSFNFSANGYWCSGRTATWNFSNGSYGAGPMYVRCQ